MSNIRIGIISEFNMNNVNYGNRLQAYALNKYLNSNFPNIKTETLYFDFFDKKIITKRMFIYRILGKVQRLTNRITKKKRISKKLRERLKKCNDFSKRNIIMPLDPVTWEKLCDSEYDAFFVGSDVVWAQSRGEVARMRFLDFKGPNEYLKFAYAASFGRDWIPEENKETIRALLEKFEMISVRENSSINLLKEVGIYSAKHTLDPTMLLGKEEWVSLSRKPQGIPEKYIFAYILGKSKQIREEIIKLSKNTFKIVAIPYASGEYNLADEDFGEIKLMDCSPEEWLWLINNAEYIITDSFHGMVFSTIFQKKFIVAEREMENDENINNRIIDYLNTIKETDKLMDFKKDISVKSLTWNYDTINEELKIKRTESINFIMKAIEKTRGIS